MVDAIPWQVMNRLRGTPGGVGPAGDDGRNPELSTQSSWVVWRLVGDLIWQNLVPFSAITGPPGTNGTNGSNGAAATIAAGSVSTLPFGSPATVTNVGTSAAATFNFGIPAGQSGTNGTNGSAATVTVGATTTLAAGSPATVANSGTSSAAILNFGIPAGVAGANGTNATVLVGSVNVGETSIITLALAVRRVTVTLAGTVTTGSYVAIPTGSPPAGYSIQDCACITNGQLTVGVLVPVLSLLSSYSIPVRVYRLN